MNMPIAVFGNSSSSLDNGIKIDTCFSVQKPYLGTIYMERIIEETLTRKIIIKFEMFLLQSILFKLPQKFMLADKFNNPSIKKRLSCRL